MFWKPEPTFEDYRVERRTRGDVTTQDLVRFTRRKRNGHTIKREVVDSEVIPEHVMIAFRCMGDVGEWRSKFKDVVDAQNLMQRAAEKLANLRPLRRAA